MKDNMESKKRVHIGCGKRNWEGWINVDGADMPHIHSNDVLLLDHSDNSISLLYACHFIGYFDAVAFETMLSFWHSKLSLGGTLRLSTPDFNAIAGLYKAGLKLEKAGFTDIHRYDHKTVAEHPNTGNREDYWDDHSAAYIDGTLISLNMECNKPLL
jgi:predicted SAM-dependent methyltransferase